MERNNQINDSSTMFSQDMPTTIMERYNSVEAGTYLLRIYPGSCAPDTIFSITEATKNTRTKEVIERVVKKLSLDNVKDYYLAEVCQESGQNCIERRLENEEYPVRVQLLWPKSPEQGPGDPTYLPTKYRFFLRSMHQENTNQPRAFHGTPALDTFMNGFQPKLDQKEYDDLCNLPDLSEDTLMDSIISRFKREKIYTYVGSILISVNPFKFFPIYNPKYVNLYQNRRLGELPPHIFAIADAAFHTMLSKKTNQCVVISGESGSGKTEATNLLLHHLTALSQKGHASGLEQTILGAGPVLEAFGNAMTVVNNNSSRFGKFIQVNYRENGTVHGAIVENYLLEKSRIVHLNADERNYHVFYYLLAGASNSEKDAFWLGKAQDYHYLNQSKTYTLEGVDEVYEFSRLKQSMEMVGFSRETMKRIFAVLSALLHLGNVEFRKKSEKDEGVTVKNVGLVKVISDLLKVKQETLLAALTTRKSVTRGDIFIVPYKIAEAVNNRDALAKCLYSALFDWIVLQVNHALMSRYEMKAEHHGNSIGVLDIFGFEDFGQNSFEQFCINFANEHLQYYFNQHVFKLEQEEYQKEGIQWDNIDFIDNTSCLNLLSKRPTGLFHLLDDDCNFPQADQYGHNLLAKFDRHHHNHECFELPPVKEASFIIIHYAGKIKYQAKEFREKNNDMMRPDIVVVLKNSNMSFLRELIGADPVAVFRWAIVRAFFRSVQAFRGAGKEFRKRGSKPKTSSIQKRLSVAKEGSVLGGVDHDVHVINPSTVGTISASSPTQPSSYQTLPGCLSPTKRHAQIMGSSKPHEGAATMTRRRTIYTDDDFWKARKVLMKNKSFKLSHGPIKGLKDLKSVMKLAHRSLHSVRYSTKKVQTTVGSQFQISLNKLMEALNQANPFFVRCIKSNSKKEPCNMDEDLLMRQLRYTGMLETVRIRRAGYNVRWTFEEFCQQYKFLLPSEFEVSREKIEEFLKNMDLEKDHYQIGDSKIFLRESERMKLQELLHQEVLRRINIIQRWVKTILAKRRYQQVREATITLQKSVRMFLAKRVLFHLKEQDLAASIIQSSWKSYKQRDAYIRLRFAVIRIQSYIRRNNAKANYLKLVEEKRRRLEEEEQRRKEEEERMKREEEERLRREEEERLRREEEERLRREEEKRLREEEEERVRVEEEQRKREEEEERIRREEEKRERKEKELLKQSEEGHSFQSDEGILTRDSSGDDLENLHQENLHAEEVLSDESSGVIEMGSSESEGILLEDDSTHIEIDNAEKTSQRAKSPVVPFTSPDKSQLMAASTPVKNSSTPREVKIIDKSETPPAEEKDNSVSVPLREKSEKRQSLLVIRPLEDKENDDRPKSISVSDMAKAYQQEVAEKSMTPAKVEPRPEKVRKIATKLSFREVQDQPQQSNKSQVQSPVSPVAPSPTALSPSAVSDDLSECREDERDLSEEDILKENTQPGEPQKSRLFWKKRRKQKKMKEYETNCGSVIKQKKKTNEKKMDFMQTSLSRTLPPSFSVNSTSQWRYPTKQLISDVNELRYMDEFLLSKINEVNHYGGRRDTIVDIVFKKAMQEYRKNLLTTYSVAMQDGQHISLMYKDLISYFERVLEHVSTTEGTIAQFPIIMGVNAFRGYLDEFVQVYKPVQQPNKKPQKKKKKKDETVEHLGHKLVPVIFNIPTACEHCTAFLWLMEKGLVCSECKFTCHKKCYTKLTMPCRGSGGSSEVFGGKIDKLVKENTKIPPIVEKCISIIEMKGLYTEGIYRKAGSAAKVKELKQLINNNPTLENINFDDYNVYIISQVLKSFFREMSQPLLTFELYDEFLRAIKFTDPKERVQSLFQVIEKLPRTNHDIFERLVVHLARVVLQETSNKMSANSLAIVFAPCLLKTDKDLPALESLQHVAKQAVCLECIITETVKRIKGTLADIRTLESAASTATKRLSTISHTHRTEVYSERTDSMESTDEEVQILSEHIKTLQEEKETLTANLPSLQLSRASAISDDDLISSDDLESLDSLGINPNEEYAATFGLPPAPLPLKHLNKKRATKQSGKRLPSKYANRAKQTDRQGESFRRQRPVGRSSPVSIRKPLKLTIVKEEQSSVEYNRTEIDMSFESQKQAVTRTASGKSQTSPSPSEEDVAHLSGLLRDIDKVLKGGKGKGPTFV